MSNYFTNAEDLGLWVKDRPTADDAARELMSIMKDKPIPEKDIKDTCRSIFDGNDQNASSVLFGILAKHNLTQLHKEAQNQSRQRNEWVRGMRNKWNRCVDGYNEGTPWRVNRDKMYDFTHYYTDALTFDADPTRVYSGEAIWRAYIMDKYSREYQDENGHWVGGYINDRFYVFPDAGTPSNPNVPKDGGNLLGLAPGERTRKPRPHQYSTERRLEESRGVETNDLEATALSYKPIAKIASNNLPNERHDDIVYNVFKDTIDMRENGFKYDDMIQKISEHYSLSLISVAEIDAQAQKILKKHNGVFYKLEKQASYTPRSTLVVETECPIICDGYEKILQPNTTVIYLGENIFEAINVPGVSKFQFVGQIPNNLKNLDAESGSDVLIQDGADDVGLNDDFSEKENMSSKNNEINLNNLSNTLNSEETNFPVNEK